MNNKNLMILNLMIVLLLFGVIYIGIQTWGTNDEAVEAIVDEEEGDLEKEQSSAVEVKENPQLIHKPFTRKKEADFELFNRDALDIKEQEGELEEEGGTKEENPDDEMEWEEPQDNINYSNGDTNTWNESSSSHETTNQNDALTKETRERSTDPIDVEENNNKDKRDENDQETESPEKPQKPDKPEVPEIGDDPDPGEGSKENVNKNNQDDEE